MGTETEIKFEVSPGDLQKLAASRSLRPSDGQLVEHRHLVSTYFDTSDHTLRRNGISLRIRRAGKKRIQTIKTSANGVAVERNEWEKRIDGDEPDLRAARGTPLQRLLSKRSKRDLDAVFSTHVHRTLVPLRPGNSRVELALDEGHIRAGLYSSPLAEVELELKSGSIGDLFKTARMVAKLVPARLALKAKSQQGYDLITDQATASVSAARIVLPAKPTLATAFQAIGRSTLHHVAANEPAVLAGLPEGVHQMRVGVRRLRAALWVFSDLLRCKQTESIRSDLKWLSGKLGQVRDLDVFLTTRVKRLEAADPPIAGLGDLVAELEYRRAVAAEAAKTAIASARYRMLILNALEWIEDGAWLRLRPALREQRIKPFAAKLFTRRVAKARKRAKDIGKLSVHDRHKLRIAMKKLRYSIYFFESLFDGHASRKALARYKDCLGSLQDNLGALNDIAVHQRMVTRFRNDIESRKSEPVAFAAGAVVGTERSETEKLLAAAEAAARRLQRAGEFWS
ncbi:CYTH and CHAD domain-containing protein [Bradyrhizobium sp.]|uniref:CYTH and CHAD domain-containing protein n=1 Tax=Bradyrhizobium sp. TaxID=376 RepID=UPI001D267AE1|nr:CYTH and CHAD domain-containing protein [Bradyrhizobium sp.]MBI5318688.1 CHAD domain-containing protein [Bradyrhizobium sp.]